MGKNQIIIIERASKGNSFGDRTFTIIAELRNSVGEPLKMKLFEETAFEGEHSAVKRLMTMDIKAWAKKNKAKFTGVV